MKLESAVRLSCAFVAYSSLRRLLLCVAASFFLAPVRGLPQTQKNHEALLSLPGEIGQSGGRLVVSLRAEPKTLNPIIAADAPSREVIGVMQADLIHINRSSQLTEPGLAKSCKVSKDGLEYSIELRRGLQFSDGKPMDANDV